MIRRPPRSTRTYTLFPYTTLFRSLHGGAFILPAAPNAHLVMVAKLCRELEADAFIPDYRLAPFNRFPAPLDDCENASRALLDRGYQASQIIIEIGRASCRERVCQYV